MFSLLFELLILEYVLSVSIYVNLIQIGHTWATFGITYNNKYG